MAQSTGPPTGDGRRGLVWVATTALLLVTAMAGAALDPGRTPTGGSPRISWLVLAALFGLAEMFVLHVQIRREAQTISLSEIPFVLGLLFTTAPEFVLARLVGPLVVFVAYRRQASFKVAFNVALQLVGATTGYLVHTAVSGPATFPDPRAIAALFVAVFIAQALETTVLGLVVGAYERALDVGSVLRGVVSYAPVPVAVSTFAVAGAYALQRDVRSAFFLAACAVVLTAVYRTFAALQERHLGLVRLYEFSQALNAAPNADTALRRVLGQVVDVAKADAAQIVLSGAGGDLGRPEKADATLTRVALDPSGNSTREEIAGASVPQSVRETVLGGGAPLLLRRGARDASSRALAVDGVRDAAWVPLKGDMGVIGYLAVTNRQGEVRGFDREDLLLLETVAAHTAIALEKGRLIDQLRYEATHDGLTGLPNRAMFSAAVDRAIGQAGERRVAVMIMDLDGFKEVNETLGHEEGDVLLREVSHRLRSSAAPDVLVARLGGDEFAVLLRDVVDADDARDVARRLLGALEQPVRLKDVDVAVSASVGIALRPDHASDLAGLLKRSDIAMYDAKSTASGLSVYEAKDDRRSPQRLALVGDLRQALAAGDIEIHVQPKASLLTGEFTGVEALARWCHAVLGDVPPDDFVALAERAGHIGELTRQVLDRALAAVGAWRAAGRTVAVAVNLSPRTLLDTDLVPGVQARLERHGVPPDLLTLEITESSLMADPVRTVSTLHALHDLGVQLAVDDFGTGYSSLSYLKRLPVHEVKIDKSFIVSMDRDPANAAIVRSIVDLGSSLGLRVVAEGVESPAVWDRLCALGCHAAQGFLLGKPMPVDDLPGWADAYERSPLAVRSDPAPLVPHVPPVPHVPHPVIRPEAPPARDGTLGA